MIVFDCEKLRFPNTGLYHFCIQLGTALLRQRDAIPAPLCAYIPEKEMGCFGANIPYRIRHTYHKLYLPHKGIQLWHSTYQLTHYMPLSVPVLQTVHDLNFLHEGISPFKQREYQKRMRKHLQQAVAIVAISEFAKNDLMNTIDVHDKPVYVIYNGYNVYEGPVQRPNGITARPFLFTIGTVMTKKNFHVLPCLLEHTDYELYIAGQDFGYAEQIMEEARKWYVADRVHIMGPVSEAEKHWMLQHCEAFLFPSIAEGFGLPVIEAMHYGKPVFLSDYTSLPEIGGDAAYYFNHDFDREQMQRDFETGLNDFSHHRAEREQALIRRAAEFSWDKAATEYIRLYRQILNT